MQTKPYIQALHNTLKGELDKMAQARKVTKATRKRLSKLVTYLCRSANGKSKNMTFGQPQGK